MRQAFLREIQNGAGKMVYTTKELSPRTYPDFERLAAKQGECWCMYYQRAKPIGRALEKAAWAKMGKQERRETWVRMNKRDKKRLVREGRSHAILVYESRIPVGWCQYGTQDELPRIDAGRNYRKVGPPAGAERLWRITCFFVDRRYRGKGVAKAGLRAALTSIRERGGGVVEAYPVVSKKMAAVPEWLWFGTPGMFEKEGFRDVAPLGTSLVLMRKKIPSKSR
jgi:ribosomal protein S18 acetylase RimI-like enzyme